MPARPKSLGVRTMPRPKWCCQIRLTITRAVSGFLGLAIQPASARRRPELARPAGTTTLDASVDAQSTCRPQRSPYCGCESS